jgi:hypothetical protein
VGSDVFSGGGRVRAITGALPLAVIVLAGVLRTKAYPGEWKEACSPGNWRRWRASPGRCGACGCSRWRSYPGPPQVVLPLRLYLAAAPENVLLGPARLVRLLVAEGFVAPSKGRTLEEVGLGPGLPRGARRQGPGGGRREGR